MRLLLIRHGRTAANEKRLYCGATDLPLSENGRAELLTVKRRGILPAPDGFRAVTSGMKRCEETLMLLYGPLPHEQLPGLREMNFGAFEMRSYEELKDTPDYQAWISGDNEQNLTPGGESGAQMAARVKKTFDALLADRQDLLLVAHGGVIALILSWLFPEIPKNRYEWQPQPGGAVLCTLPEGGCASYRFLK